jgi:FHS family L-fucose permease-like MFS transporter
MGILYPMTAPKNQNAIYIIGALFFIFGFITWLNSTLIPYLKLVCELQNYVQAFFVTFAFYMSYLVLALPASYVLKIIGFKRGMALGLAILGIGALVFIPAARQRSFPLFLFGLFVQGGGLSLLQTASNPYVSILGPLESAAKRISIMGVCNKGGGILSPLILGTLLLQGTDAIRNQVEKTVDAATRERLLADLSGRVVMPYLVMGITLIVLAFLFLRSGLPEIETEQSVAGDLTMPAQDKTSIFDYPQLWLGVVCLFVYVGVEVMAGDAIAVYGQAEGMTISTTRYFSAFTLGSMLAGYLVGIICIPNIFSQQMGLRISALLGLVLTIGAYFTAGYSAITCIALLGLANALMWPAIWPLAIDGLGRHIKTGAALLVMGIAGGAVIPLLYASLKDHPGIGNKLAFFYCVFPCYIYIFYYAVWGHKRRKQRLRTALA